MPGYSEVCIWLQDDNMRDISTAIYQAERARGLPEQKIAERFYQRLSGKTVQFISWTSCVPQASESNA